MENEKAIVYDLPSENMRVYVFSDIRDRVRAVRVRSTQLLHSLGVQCTESVILVPSTRVDAIEPTINRVRSMYQNLETELRDRGLPLGLPLRLEPIIEVLDLTREQTDRLIPIAERRLISQLDRTIDRVSTILDDLTSITEEVRLRRIRSNLRRLRDNWSHIFELATRLGIDISRDHEYLIELIDQAIRRT